MIHKSTSSQLSPLSVVYDQPCRILVITADYYPDITQHLRAGCDSCLEHCAPHAQVTKVDVDGALEIAQAVVRCHNKMTIDGVVALGCVIKGETSHFDIVSSYSIALLLDKCLLLNLPLGNGILTVDTHQQAHERSQWPAPPAQMVKANKGAAAAHAMLSVLRI